ncbi:MAG: hypothetical protein QOJ19_3367, partial [Acidimicrobiia bacterium]|nr:hypothetical protein [Acidimicrobiia bacterium]
MDGRVPGNGGAAALEARPQAGFNLAALALVADRLSQAEDDWRPFYAPSFMRAFYPRPESWEPHHPKTRGR